MDIELKAGKAKGIEIPLHNANLVLILAPKGYVMCGYLNIEAANRFGDLAAVVKGVKTVEDMLNGRVSQVSKAASGLGIEPGMDCKTALEKLF